MAEEKHTSTGKVVVSSKDAFQDKEKALQSHAATEPAAVSTACKPCTERQSVEEQESVADVDLLDKLRQDVAEHRSMLKRPDQILKMIDKATRESDEDRAMTTHLLMLLVSAEKEAWENRDRWIRSCADLENYKKRTVQEKSRLFKYQYEDVLRDLLPVLDNLERAVDHATNAEVPDAFIEGVTMVAGLLRNVLEKHGITVIEALGKPFDPAVHEAMFSEPATGKEPNTVILELEKGYMYKDRLLRPTKVAIST